MLDQLARNFVEKGSVNDALMIVRFCKNQNIHRLGMMLGEYLCQIFPAYADILLETAQCQYACQEYKKSYQTYYKLLSMHNLPTNVVPKILEIQAKCIDHISDQYTYYDKDLVQKLTQRKPSAFPLITVTITSCKRYDLFEATVNSFINCCTDIDLVDHWLCIDDNSSDEDRKKMMEKFPFIEFYMKTPEEKGHPRSMNLIRDRVKTPYIFHMEDDWKFFCKHDYLSHCMDVLSQNIIIGQCLINRNYTEVAKDIHIKGGIPNLTSYGRRYYIHEHCETEIQQKMFYIKYGPCYNSAYWPHFSFRPSLVKISIWKELGPFDEKVSHFERKYADMWKAKGYISAFMEGIYCLHTGRLTSERHDTTKQNAYTLNGEAQFVGKEKQLAVKKKTAPEDLESPDLSRVKTYILNLDRRLDRWEKFQQEEAPKFLNYERFSAVDGSLLKPTELLQRIFDGNDYNMRQGMVGCAMSHIKMCLELINSDYDAFCIMEDDLNFVPNFRQKFEHVYRSLGDDWDICYLGHHLWKQYRNPLYYDKVKMPVVEKWNVAKTFRMSMGGTGAYLISKKGAIGLLKFINKNGMTNGIDTVQQKAADDINIYYCTPHLIYSECWTGDNNPDTDIQHDFTSLTIPIDQRYQTEKAKYENVIELTDQKEATKYVEDKSKKQVMFYKGPRVRQINEKSVHPSYTLNYKVLIVVPDAPHPFERLKQKGKFSLDGVLKNKEPYKFIAIPLGNTHTRDSLKNAGVKFIDYPFEDMNGGTFEVFSLLTELTVKMNDEELDKFLDEMFDIPSNKEYLQEWNNKIVFVNTKYNVSFPHDDIDNLKEKYTKLFKNLRDTIKGDTPVLFFYISRWKTSPIGNYEHFMDVINKYNPRATMLVINGIVDTDFPKKKYVDKITYISKPYRKDMRSDEWSTEQISYDQKIFAPSLHKIVKEFLNTVRLKIS